MKREEEKLISFLQEQLGRTAELKNGTLNCHLPELTIDELGRILRVTPSTIVSFFWKSGRTITKNQPLSFELIDEFCASRKVKAVLSEPVSINSAVDQFLVSSGKKGEILRIPVVSIMGHIDHGKSTTLDTIRGSSDQKLEEGGITQKISIHPVIYNNRKINFLDTPGHNVFLKMRERGAAFTDLVVLVIAAEDGIMPQTVEVIEHIHRYKIPTIAFINNKRKGTNEQKSLDKIMTQLQERGLTPSEWGGETTVLSGSAISKESTNELLENILLLSEVYEWKGSTNCPANGLILDSYINNNEGIINTLLVKNGQLRRSEGIFVNGEYGKLRKMNDFTSTEVETAGPGEIVQISGLDFQAEPGDNFLVLENKNLVKKIKRILPARNENRKAVNQQNKHEAGETNVKHVNLILIADSQSSLEALANVVHQSSTSSVIFNAVDEEVGELNESLISLAKITDSSLMLFNIKVSQQRAKELQERKIKWFSSSVIYKIGDGLDVIVNSLRERKKIEKVVGTAEIKKVFTFSEVGKIAGCQILSGSINRNHQIGVFRHDEKLFVGKLTSLQRDKNNIKEALKNQECGIVLANFTDFQVGDRIVSYALVDEE